MWNPIFHIVFLFAVFVTGSANAQKVTWFDQSDTLKSAFYLSWGYNVSGYTKSDIRFTGSDYDFTFYGVEAVDRPTPFDPKVYFKLSQFTIPQYNLRIGYEFKKNWTLGLSVDHMKYVLNNINQYRNVTGFVNVEDYPFNEVFDGTPRRMSNYLNIEHTDGLNYINIELYRNWSVLRVKNKNAKTVLEWKVLAGVSTGALLPKTNALVLGKERNDEFHLAGYAASGNVGVNFIFLRYITLQSFFKAGWINMPDILTTGKSNVDRARQSFGFGQYNFLIGCRIPFSGNKKD